MSSRTYWYWDDFREWQRFQDFAQGFWILHWRAITVSDGAWPYNPRIAKERYCKWWPTSNQILADETCFRYFVSIVISGSLLIQRHIRFVFTPNLFDLNDANSYSQAFFLRRMVCHISLARPPLRLKYTLGLVQERKGPMLLTTSSYSLGRVSWVSKV